MILLGHSMPFYAHLVRLVCQERIDTYSYMLVQSIRKHYTLYVLMNRERGRRLTSRIPRTFAVSVFEVRKVGIHWVDPLVRPSIQGCKSYR